MSVRKTVKWLVLFVAVLAAAGGGYTYWWWSNSNRILLQTLREELADAAPGWNLTVESARFDWHRRIHVFNLTLKSRDGRSTLLRIPETVLVVDREKLADSQIVDVQRIRLIRPEVHFVRDGKGKWNWQDLPPLKSSPQKRSLPEIVLEDATVHVRLRPLALLHGEQGDGSIFPGTRSEKTGRQGGKTDSSPTSRDTVVQLRQGSLKLVPESRRQFLVQGSTAVRDAGKLAISGRWHLDTKAWSLDGRMENVLARGELLALAAGASPELRSHVGRLQRALRDFTPPDERPKSPGASGAPPDFGASGMVDVSFHLGKLATDKELQFDLHARVRQGRIRNPALPLELHELAGDVHWNNSRVAIRNVSARSGTLSLAAQALIRRVGDATPIRIQFKVANLPLNVALEKRLPADWRPYYRRIAPQGLVDVSGTLEYDGRKDWSHHGCVLTTHDCSFAHADFPYRFTRVNGTVTQQGDELALHFTGLAGRQPATLSGRVKNPGPEAASRYVLKITDFQLDEALLAACKPGVRKTLTSLGADGQADVQFTSDDPGGRTSIARMRLLARLKNCTLEYDDFPYRFRRLNGTVHYDSKTDVWTFSNLTAINGPGSFTGNGFLSDEQGKSHLELNVTGTGASLDKPLYRALPKSLQDLWGDLSPTGMMDLSVALKWTEGSPLQLTVPKCRVTKGTMTVQSFPYVFENISAQFAYEEGTLRILSFDARHDDTLIRAEGFAETPPGGGWRLRLTKFLADDLVPDRTFRRALNKDLRSVVEELDPDGPISVAGMIEFWGTGKKGDPVTAGWHVKLVLAGTSLNFGVKLKDVHGRVFVKGTWDGKRVDMWTFNGNRFDLDSLNVHGYQFTKVKGPFALYDKRLVVGTTDVFKPRKPGKDAPPIDRRRQLTAAAVGGEFTLNAEAWFGKQTSYRLIVTMNQARLERFARRYLKGAKNLKGVMYGRVELQGTGKSNRNLSGRGKLLISPAALYELPVLVQIFNVLNFVPVDKTAFKFAFADFDIKERKYLFRTIDLVGDSLSLRGRGTVLFDGKLEIDFYSMVSRSRVPVAVVRQLLKSATSGWVGVKVRGTVSRPMAQIRPIPQVDDALKQFLNALGGPPAGVLPWFQSPPPQSSRSGNRLR